MKDYLNLINGSYPIRKTKKEKNAFIEFVKKEINNTQYQFHVETLEKKHNNIIIGNIKEANIIFTAHYDTPATSIIPNLMLPRNKFLGLCYHLGFPILLSLLSLVVAFVISEITNMTLKFTVVLYLILYLTSFTLLTKTFKNKNNMNDNTSGVATVLELALKSTSKNIAFVLFDNEEKGLLGSKTFQNKHHESLKNKLIINFDCVGLGKNLLFICKDKALNHVYFDKLKIMFKDSNGYKVSFIPYKGSFANSDFKNFECGIGVMACKKTKNDIYYTNKIHTNNDKLIDKDNILFIVNNMSEFVKGEYEKD